jgi:hypothetical protein
MESSVDLRPIQIECDAPPYEIVQASGQVGIRSPEDVRWCRRPSPARNTAAGWRAVTGRIWNLLFAFGISDSEETCLCGNHLPERFPVLFRWPSRGDSCCTLTQCGRCRTVFWEPLPAPHPVGSEN